MGRGIKVKALRVAAGCAVTLAGIAWAVPVSAQVVHIGRERQKLDAMEYFQRDHAWFAAYAPAEAPELVVAVLNEHSGHGGTEAEPIAVAIIDAYLELKHGARAQAVASGANESRP